MEVAAHLEPEVARLIVVVVVVRVEAIDVAGQLPLRLLKSAEVLDALGVSRTFADATSAGPLKLFGW